MKGTVNPLLSQNFVANNCIHVTFNLEDVSYFLLLSYKTVSWHPRPNNRKFGGVPSTHRMGQKLVSKLEGNRKSTKSIIQLRYVMSFARVLECKA